MDENGTLLQATCVSKHFPLRGRLLRGRVVRAVDNATFSVGNGEALVLMGESGCGKTTCALTTVRLIEPTGGDVLFRGQRLFSLQRDALRRIRRDMQIVLQNPLASLDPRVTGRQAIAEPMRIHRRQLRMSRKAMDDRVSNLADTVGLREEELDRYPRELSGGQQQRLCICRALVLQPVFLVMDEPTSALDVSVQARVLNLILDLRENLNLTYLFVTHSAAVARYVGNRIAIMYLGQIVELGDAQQVFDDPLHPYTQALLGSVLSPTTPIDQKRVTLEGTPERPIDLPVGCVFQRRCGDVKQECREDVPDLIEGRAGHWVRCYRTSEITSVPKKSENDDIVGEGPGALQ